MVWRKSVRRIGVAVAMLVLAILACGPEEAGLPNVTISEPVNGMAVAVGEEVQIISAAEAEGGVARVELTVNGQVIRSDLPPSGNPTTFSIAQPWTPSAEGEVTISVVAYDVAGLASPPAIITLRVQATAAEVTPAPEAATPTPVPDVEGEGGCTLNASYVADVTIPDNTELDPGVAFVKTWRIRNSGTCDWGSGFNLVFVNGDQMGAQASVAVPATAAGSTADVSISLTAPGAPGTYRGDWRMQSDEGVVFGSIVYVQIVVPAPATNTPEPTEEAASPPTNLQATIQPNGSVLFTWDDAVGETMYEYEFGFVAGGLGAAVADTLPADTTSWNGGVVDCGGSGSFDLTAIAEGGAEIGGETVDFTTPACEAVTEDIVADADAFWWPNNLACISCPDFSTGTELELINTVTGNPPFQLLNAGRIALHFDLGGIPAGATIQDATLHFYLNSADGPTSVAVSTVSITSPWSESDHTVKPTCDGTAGGSRNVGSGSGWYDWDVTDIVQGQHTNPSTNYGICLRASEGDAERVFRSREGSAVSRPYLRVTYQP